MSSWRARRAAPPRTPTGRAWTRSGSSSTASGTLLRQRRAERAAGRDPDEASRRDARTVEGYEQ